MKSVSEHYKELKADKVEWLKLRARLLANQDFRCAYCLESLVGKRMNVEHLIPLKKGGTNSFKNLLASCPSCNKFKGNMLFDDEEIKAIRRQVIQLRKEAEYKRQCAIEASDAEILSTIREFVWNKR